MFQFNPIDATLTGLNNPINVSILTDPQVRARIKELLDITSGGSSFITSVTDSATIDLNVSGGGNLTADFINSAGYVTPSSVATFTNKTGDIGQWTGVLALANGGSSKSLTALNGGIVYSDADSMEISPSGLSGYLLESNGATAPDWTFRLADGFTATTQPPNDNSEKIATTAYVDTFVAAQGYALVLNGTSTAPADSTTYYLGSMNGSNITALSTTGALRAMPIPFSGTLIRVEVFIRNSVGSAQNSELYFRYDNTSNTTLSTTIDHSSASIFFSATGLSTAVEAGHYCECQWVTPAWTPTNPTNVAITAVCYIKTA